MKCEIPFSGIIGSPNVYTYVKYHCKIEAAYEYRLKDSLSLGDVIELTKAYIKQDFTLNKAYHEKGITKSVIYDQFEGGQQLTIGQKVWFS